MSDIKSALINIHSVRGEMYTFFGKVFGTVPDAEYLNMLNGIAPKLKILAENTDNENIKTGTQGVLSFLDKRNSLKDNALVEFDMETSRHYTTLYCMVRSIPTDESIYTSVDHRERQRPYDDMIALFKKYGMQKTAKLSENEDFISYELIFMARLAYACVDFLTKDDSALYAEYMQEQYNFHINHFDKWVYEFFERTVKSGLNEDRLYKHLAVLCAGFLTEDKAVLQELSE